MRFQCHFATVLVVALPLISCSRASADLISWDFNTSDTHNSGPPTSALMVGPVSAENAGAFGSGFGHAAGIPWNSVNAGPALDAPVTGTTSGPMQTDAGVATGVTWTVTSGNHRTFQSGADNDLRRDVLFLDGTTATSFGWEISGLVPGNLYDINIFGQLDNTNGPPIRDATHTVTGDNGIFGPTFSDTVATFLSVEALADGTITGVMAQPESIASMSGMQIRGDFTIPATVPEPGSIWLLFGVTGLSCAVWLRQKTQR